LGVLLTCFKGTELLLEFLWGPAPKVFFGFLSVHYIFDAAEACALTAFLFSGTWHGLREYNGWH
jgi:hypothetical protein